MSFWREKPCSFLIRYVLYTLYDLLPCSLFKRYVQYALRPAVTLFTTHVLFYCSAIQLSYFSSLLASIKKLDIKFYGKWQTLSCPCVISFTRNLTFIANTKLHSPSCDKANCCPKQGFLPFTEKINVLLASLFFYCHLTTKDLKTVNKRFFKL